MTKSVAIVTGPSQGIGQATAVRLVRDFSTIVLVARNLEHLNRTANRWNWEVPNRSCSIWI